jgi:hypothetical protein
MEKNCCDNQTDNKSASYIDMCVGVSSIRTQFVDYLAPTKPGGGSEFGGGGGEGNCSPDNNYIDMSGGSCRLQYMETNLLQGIQGPCCPQKDGGKGFVDLCNGQLFLDGGLNATLDAQTQVGKFTFLANAAAIDEGQPVVDTEYHAGINTQVFADYAKFSIQGKHDYGKPYSPGEALYTSNQKYNYRGFSTEAFTGNTLVVGESSYFEVTQQYGGYMQLKDRNLQGAYAYTEINLNYTQGNQSYIADNARTGLMASVVNRDDEEEYVPGQYYTSVFPQQAYMYLTSGRAKSTPTGDASPVFYTQLNSKADSGINNQLVFVGNTFQLYVDADLGVFEFVPKNAIYNNLGKLRFNAQDGSLTLNTTGGEGLGVALDCFTGEIKSFNNSGSKYVTISPDEINLYDSDAGSVRIYGPGEKDDVAYWQEIEVCVDGATKKAKVLMTVPK